MSDHTLSENMSVGYQRLTYRQLADCLGITVSGAQSLAASRKWAKCISFDGKARVTVPTADLVKRSDARVRKSSKQSAGERKAELLKSRNSADEQRREKVRLFYRENAAALTHPQSQWKQLVLADLGPTC